MKIFNKSTPVKSHKMGATKSQFNWVNPIRSHIAGPALRGFNRTSKQKGITLIEVLVAMFVVVTGITGSLSLIVQTMAFTSLSSSRLVAAYLAQEGVEIVRNIRDNNWLNDPTGSTWNNNLNDGDYQAQYDSSPPLNSFDPSGSLVLNGDFYIQGSGGRFQRKININRDSDCGGVVDGCIKVTVEVSWEQRGRHEIEVQEYLYNWK